MGKTELIGMVRDVNAQYASLFGQMITINFAMIVAIYYFLHRASVKLKLAAFLFYLIGMLSLIGLILMQANLKSFAVDALAAVPPGHLSSLGARYLVFCTSWVAAATAAFMDISMWVMVGVVIYLLFWWKGDRDAREPATPAQ